MVEIKDGTGTGRKVEVDVDQHLHCRAVDESLEHYSNEARGDAYQLVFACTGLYPGATFLYIKNTDNDKNLVIEGVKLYVTCDPVIDHFVNMTVGGTVEANSKTPANVNAGAGNVADGTFYSCMSGAISGVTGGTLIDRNWECSGCVDKYYNYNMDVVVPNNKDWALKMVGPGCSGCNIGGVVPFYYSRTEIHV